MPSRPQPSTQRVNIAVFARAPIPGAAKTRLIPALGAAGAARLHRQLVIRTLKTAYAAGLGPVTLWGAPDLSHGFFQALQKCGMQCREQINGDLGERMQHALTATLPAPTLLIGSDCACLTADHLRSAAHSLSSGFDAVFLPAEDGGYALIGLRAPAANALFDAMPWGGPAVMALTRSRLAAIGYAWEEPAVVWDIDTPADLLRWRTIAR